MRIAVLASGRGTNLEALLATVHGREVEIVAVAGDRPGAVALETARAAGVAVRTFPVADFGDRIERDVALAGWLEEAGAELIVLAGYMAILDPLFVGRFPGRIVNVHPSLLPSFPGLDAIGQALAHGVKVTGVTVHLVDDGVDTGPILLQEAVAIPDGATREELHALLQPVEHRLLPEAVRRIAAAG